VKVDRKSRVQLALQDAGLAAVVCSLPSNVLLLTGYWPVVGESVAICVSGGPTLLLVPEDEVELAATGFADSVETFVPETLDHLSSVSESVRPHLARILQRVKIGTGAVGVESGGSSQPASYLAVHLFGNHLGDMLQELLPHSALAPIDQWIRSLGSVKTPAELDRIRQACVIAKNGFEQGASQLRAGMTEPEVAQLFRAPLSMTEVSGPQVYRCDGFAFCMSGPNSAKAYAAYARTRWRIIESKDLVMLHCNSYADGFWTDITRTFTLLPPDKQQTRMYAAIFAARNSALSTIKPGIPAAEVDSAARQVIQEFGFGQYLKHGTGHGVGFSPMSAYNIPQIHAESPDVLEEGMIFNVEPAVYIEGYGGMRHCDMVAVTGKGHELLTEFQSDADDLTVGNAETRSRGSVQRAATR
jgi:Xaa-Pro aminopeptidase